MQNTRISFDISFFVSPFVIVLACLSLLLPVAAGAASDKSAQKPVSPSPSSQTLSHVRVVRLSFLQGTAAVRRPGSDKWTEAMANTPIQEGFVLATDKGSFLEVEFENGSTVRLGERSELDFTQLALSADGGHINHLILENGYATVDVIPKKNDEYTMTAGGVEMTPTGKTEFRADLDQDHMRLEVFGGHVMAADASQNETLGKNHVLVRDTGNAASFQLSDKLQKDDWDKWTAARSQQASLAYDEEAVNVGSPLYGWGDLDVYGEWGYFPGFGNGWMPYEPAGWSPYSLGAWDFYDGLGYTWVSGEPWGWLPFHYGYWNFNPAAGWFWMPGPVSAAWSPALVNWYSGPGWVGWVPVGPAGLGGRLPCTLAVNGCLTAVPPGVLSNGQPIKPGSTGLVHPTNVETFTQIAQPSVAPVVHSVTGFAPAATAAPVQFAAGHNAATVGGGAPASAVVQFARGSGSAPSSVIMGRQVSTQTFLARHSNEPVRIKMGATMGGNLPSGAGAGGRAAFAGGTRAATTNGNVSAGGPHILARGSSGSNVGGSGGGFAPVGGGSAGVSGGGGAPAGGGGSSGSVVHH